jgi:hypothetical protein
MFSFIGLFESGLVISVNMKLINDPAGIYVAKFLLGDSNSSISLLLAEMTTSKLTVCLSPESVQAISPSSQKEVP